MTAREPFLTAAPAYGEKVGMATTEQRLAELERLVSGMIDWQTASSRTEQMDDAKAMALFSIVQELSERSGISLEAFHAHYETRFRWWHDYYLREAENVSPGLAAELDTRTLEQSDVSERYPPLFDSPPPESRE